MDVPGFDKRMVSLELFNLPANGPKTGTVSGTPCLARKAASLDESPGLKVTSTRKLPPGKVIFAGNEKLKPPPIRQVLSGAAGSNSGTLVALVFCNSTNS